MENNQLSDKLKQINSGIDFKRLLGTFLSNWYWFALSVSILFSLGFLYLRYTTPEFAVKSSLLIEEQPRSAASALMNNLSKNDDNSGSPNLFNEMFVLRSQDLIGRVVDSLSLNIQYWAQGRIKEDEIYETSPIRIVFDSAGFIAGYPQEIRIRQIVDGLFEFKEEKITDRVMYDTWIQRPYGRFKILYKKGLYTNTGYLHNSTELIIRIDPAKGTTDKVMARFGVNVSDGRTSLLDLYYTDNIRFRGVDFLNSLIFFYQKKELEDINRFAEKTRIFIDQRKAELIRAIQSIDSTEVDIKVENDLVDVKTQTSSLLAEKNQAQQAIQQLLVQKQAVRALHEDIINGSGARYQVVAGLGVSDPFLSSLVANYNALIQQKSTLEKNLGAMHPSLEKIKGDIASVRKQIAEATDRVLASLDISMQNSARNLSEYNQRLQEVPDVDRDITDARREYNVLQNIYLYLYQRGVENEITQYAATNKSRLVVAPYASDTPISPIKKNIYGMMILLGLLIPSSIIVARVMLNNKVVNEKDIESITSIPIIGAISRAPDGTGKKNIVVGPHIRTGIAEQFRLIRANLEFMAATNNKRVFLITSSMSGEGKTFISLNLGITMTLAKKRVVIMEFDLRKPKLSSYLGLHNEGGISGYIAGQHGMDKVLKASGVHENLYIANCGPIPPNPGELLVLPTTRQLLEELQEMFDVIIIDTAPVGLVSDALILSQYSDVNIYVIRQTYTIKEQIRVFDTLYKERKIRNPAIVFNGVEYLKKYGYGYGGSYGYSYGGGGYYDEDAKPKRSLIDRLFKKSARITSR